VPDLQTSTSPFFEHLRERSRLPAVISRPALVRALDRAGLSPETVGAGNQQEALDSIRMTLRVYHEEGEIPLLMKDLAALCQETP
jgi:hypothetical protein